MVEHTVVRVLYTVAEGAEAPRLSRSVIDELIRSGRLRTVRQGRRRLVPVHGLKKYVTSLDGASWAGAAADSGGSRRSP